MLPLATVSVWFAFFRKKNQTVADFSRRRRRRLLLSLLFDLIQFSLKPTREATMMMTTGPMLMLVPIKRTTAAERHARTPECRCKHSGSLLFSIQNEHQLLRQSN